jgi:cytochrome c553
MQSTHPRARTLLRLACLLLSLGCGHSENAQRSQPTVPHEVAQPPSAPVQSPVAPPVRLSTHPLAPEQLVELMRTHFMLAIWARDCVSDGDLEGLRAPLLEAAQLDYSAAVPPSWLPGILQLQAAAESTARARTLRSAATGVATFARICGQCHLEQGHPLRRDPPPVREPSSPPDRMSALMFRHFWASTQLWEGLVAPSDEAWALGAATLAHLPSQAPGDSGLAADFAHALQQLRELGVEASGAKTPSERSELYARTLSTCANCHARNGVFEPQSQPAAGAAHP